MTDFFLPPEGTSVLPDDSGIEDPTDDLASTSYYGSEYHFDPDLGDLVVDPDTGKVALLTGADALNQSLAKHLRTERYAHLAYGPDYGCEAVTVLQEPPLGSTPDDIALSYAAETIEADDRVDSVDTLDAVVDVEAETITVTGWVKDVYGEVTWLGEVWPSTSVIIP